MLTLAVSCLFFRGKQGGKTIFLLINTTKTFLDSFQVLVFRLLGLLKTAPDFLLFFLKSIPADI
ncbi:hypothetical protein BOX30_00625 [Leptospirillum ferriphilum]|uniref:Uncharacterized protein n=2 Tax=Leptospirillum ferriphilum TaxID=178606 RepID=A0A059XY50_9BACT|nr:hypothetical protein Y981_08090 [Leptospirillum ferriphilum YSK]OOH72684.1 hypothetical protein BOX24_06745 [Leptospirillum ferriphilum]OOH84175.1 hypothetical protein BOX30_00625 [Leptospirillum ferriphilum]